MPRPGRAYWKGFLRLSLVSIPVEIYTAVETAAAISLNQIHKPTGKRINYTKTVKGRALMRSLSYHSPQLVPRDWKWPMARSEVPIVCAAKSVAA